MLTESEREWAIKKSKWIKRNIYYLPEYPTKDELLNAAEFSERVAAKLAEFYHHTTLYLDDSDGQKLRCWETCPARFYCGDSYTHLTCGDAVLKAAQLEVEEEMDNGA